MNNSKDIIEFLYAAEWNAFEVTKVTDGYPELTNNEAYELQDGTLARKLAESATKTVGVKLGLTSKAKWEMIGVNEAIYGYLHSDMLALIRESIEYSELIHLKVEPEIAFLLAKDLEGADIMEEDVINAAKYVAPALEIIDSK